MRELVVVGALGEALIAALAFALGGLMAAVAALVGTSVAFAAQILAVALLRPAMRAGTRVFAQRWGAGIAIRFGSFLLFAALSVALRDVLPVPWLAAGYLGLLLTLLFAETRFLK